jgi:hypothetical protein
MDGQQQPEREVVQAREDLLGFASEEEERAWWATHDIADKLGHDVTEEQRAHIRRTAQRARMIVPQVAIEEVTDPEEIAAFQSHWERYRRNGAVFRERRAKIYRDCRGKVVVIAEGELYTADTAEEAWAWAQERHPHDDGVLVQYIPKEKAWRIYAEAMRRRSCARKRH